MAFALKRRLYEAMPSRVKSLVRVLPFGFWAGKAYRRVLRRGAWFDRAEEGQIRAWQSRALGDLLRFAAREVPAYEHLRATVDRLEPFEALEAFPIIDKNDLQADMARYLPACLSEIPHYRITTGGTSGNQLTLQVDDDYQATEMGFMHRQWARIGYRPSCRKATFRGVSFPSLPEGVYWQKNPIYNELQFSPFHMSERTMGAYVERLCRFAPEFLHGYPSAISMLADYILRHCLEERVGFVRGALLASEGPLPGQREAIEQAFSCPSLSWYGHSERGLLGVECSAGAGYHAVPDYGLLELLDSQGRLITSKPDPGEMTVTGLQNRCLPLIRYRTGDWAVKVDEPCPCGRSWQRFAQVKGHRGQDCLLGSHGERLTLAALNMHGPLFARVQRFQYFQAKPGVAELRLMTQPDFTGQDLRRIEQAYASKTHRCLELRIRIVDNIELTARGKYKMLDSRIDSTPSLEHRRNAS